MGTGIWVHGGWLQRGNEFVSFLAVAELLSFSVFGFPLGCGAHLVVGMHTARWLWSSLLATGEKKKQISQKRHRARRVMSEWWWGTNM